MTTAVGVPFSSEAEGPSYRIPDEVAVHELWLYTVHVKHVTASEARRNWFRLLDEVAQGEVVALERHGKRIVLRSEDEEATPSEAPDYRALLQVPDADAVDRWSWEWAGPEGELSFRTRDPES